MCFKKVRVHTRDISDILTSLVGPDNKQSRTILTEGGPGLGKSVLLKQIAYEWAQGKVLRNTLLIHMCKMSLNLTIWCGICVQFIIRMLLYC